MSIKLFHSVDAARTMWCPQATDEDTQNCIASRCMAWRWVETNIKDGEGTKVSGDTHGYCGLAGRPML